MRHDSTIRSRPLLLCILLVAGMVLAGCQSKNPMDYLPQATGGYMGLNMTMMRESAGLKKLGDAMKKYRANTEFDSDKAQKVYLGFDMPSNLSTAPTMYGVAIGLPGFADEVVQQYKASGATEGKTAGRATYTSGTASISPVGKTGILVFKDPSTLERMVAVSKKKEPGAKTSPEFTYVSSTLVDHAVVLAAKAAPLIEKAGPMMAPLQATNPKAVEALKKVTMASMAFNWDAQPVLELYLQLSDKAQADALAAAINGYLGFAKVMPAVTSNPNIAKIVTPLQATSSEDGVHLKVEVPADVADQLFTQMEAMAKNQGQRGAGQFGAGQIGAGGIPAPPM